MNDIQPPKSEKHDLPDLPLQIRATSDTSPKGDPATRTGILWRVFKILRFVPLVLLMIATIGVVALYFQPPGLQKLMQVLNLQPGGGTTTPIAIPFEKPSPAGKTAATNAAPIVGLGILLPEGDVTEVALPFGAGDARVKSIEVTEGEPVTSGQLIARLDNEGAIRALIENARAAVSARQAQLEQTRKSVSASIAETSAALRKAEAALENANGELTRARSLFERGYTTNSVLESRTASANQAANEVERLKATLARFNGDDLENQPDVKVAQRNLESARADLAKAQNDLSRALVHSPVDGTVLKIHARPGERPPQSGLIDIGNIDRMTAKVEIYQTEIGNVEIGAEAELRAEALPLPMTGTVSAIGLEVGRQTLVDLSPAANTDARVVEVTVSLDEASSKAARRYTNLQVIARIERQQP